MDNEKFKYKYRIDSARLKGWNYSKNGWYFVTICTKDKICFFGDVKNEKMHLSKIGKIAKQYWLAIPTHFPFVTLDEFITMPNHIHGIIIIDNVETQNFASLRYCGNKFGPQSKNLASIIRGFKIGTQKYATVNKIPFAWQSRFYDHIIRDEKSLNNIRQYIINNPAKWGLDQYNPKN